MPIRLLIMIALALIALCAAAISVIFVLPYPPTDLDPLLAAPPDCAMPCWQGIQPGKTSLDEAIALLERSPWVSEIYPALNSVDWEWNGAQPALYDDTSGWQFQGRMQFDQDDTIMNVVMRTRLSFGALWMALGTPDRVMLLSPDSTLPFSYIYHIAVYDRYSLYAFSIVECPTTPRAFWNAPLNIAFGWPNLIPTEIANNAPYELPRWLFRRNVSGCG